MFSKIIVFVAATASAARFNAAKNPVQDNYIVVFKQGTEKSHVDKHMDAVRGVNATVKFEYNINSGEFMGYSTIAPKAALELIMNHEHVEFVEEDGVVSTACDGRVQSGLPAGLWGLSRSSDVSRQPTDYSNYLYTNDGTGVEVHVMDTGIRTTHVDFGGRAREGADFTGEGPGDGNGHGTHCASTVGGTQYGIAKNVELVAVKVLGRTGSGTFAGVIAGIDWTAARPAGVRRVGSLSLGGGFSAAVNAAVDAASAAGVTMVIASGNSNTNACNFSPASAVSAVTVNSIQRGDQRSSFSNFGACTDIFAPGTSVLGAWITSDTSTNTISGTSMACPHVAGQAAKLLQLIPGASPSEIKRALVDTALDGIVPNAGLNSPNKLLNGC